MSTATELCEPPTLGGDVVGASDDKSSTAKLFLLITNISKRSNVRSLLLTASAFGCSTVFVVGQKKFDFEPSGPDLPAQIREQIEQGGMRIIRFDKLGECVQHINSIGVELIGVEIDERAVDIEECKFRGDTCFMMGNEGQGMNEKQKSFCDSFVKISQYGGGTASLNVYVAASIVLHRFHHWARGDVIGDNAG